MKTAGNPWYNSWKARAAARWRLVCFPHAGGTASFFRSWWPNLPADVALAAAQYPGREERLEHTAALSIAQLADQLARALEPLAAIPLVLLGHSMGAAVAFEVARRLEQRGIAPLRLCVSGRPAPRQQRRTQIHHYDDDRLAAEITRLGATAPEVFSNPELRALVLPMIRHDYRLIESYAPTSARLACPITALGGMADTEAHPDELDGWREHTSSFDLELFEGDHFYLVPQRSQVVLSVVRRVNHAIGMHRSWPSTP